MNIKLYDIYGEMKIKGNYKSLADCMVKNKHNMENIDFTKIDFRTMDFSGLDFSRANFRSASFTGVDFSYADFGKVNFKHSVFTHSDFYNITLSHTNFNEVDFSYTTFYRANFYNMNVHKSNFEGAIFSSADFSYANLLATPISIFQLYDAHCVNTSLDHKLIKIQGARHLFCYYNGMIKIGCECHSVQDWLDHGAYSFEYPIWDQREYMEYIEMVSKLEE